MTQLFDLNCAFLQKWQLVVLLHLFSTIFRVQQAHIAVLQSINAQCYVIALRNIVRDCEKTPYACKLKYSKENRLQALTLNFQAAQSLTEPKYGKSIWTVLLFLLSSF